MWVGDALDYVRETASPDVVETLDAVITAGFGVRLERGGKGESFGNVLVELERPPVALRLTKDRGQWTMDIDPDGRGFQALHVLLTAKTGDGPWLEERSLGDPIPKQWPPGVAWRTAVPALLKWLSEADRTDSIRTAHEQWVRVMRQRYGPGVQ